MGKIFCLMGKSSSGKDTIYKKLMTSEQASFSKIVLYTTRPIREGEKEGREYHFILDEEMTALEQQGKIVEMRAYDTCYGVWKYATIDENMDLENRNYLMIGTIEAFVALKKYYGSDVVVPIMIELDDGVRLQRALDRERQQNVPKYSELCRRFLADEADFSSERKLEAGIERVFVNDDLDRCTKEILDYIM